MTASAHESPSESTVLVGLRDGVLTITLNDPATGNLVDASMSSAIVQAVQAIGSEVKAICLRGAGGDFCAGRKSPTPPKGGAVPSAEKLRHLVAEPALALYDAIKFAPVPTIAVVQGRAFGVGAALACVCDITLAQTQARFSIPELERDIPPALVMAALHDRVPLKTLAMLVYTREEITAADALRSGLISMVVPDEELEPTALRWLANFVSNSPVALRACKQYLTHAPSMSATGASAFASHVIGTALSARY
jgi:enoyl-CoA hydratase/carnithine racemase